MLLINFHYLLLGNNSLFGISNDYYGEVSFQSNSSERYKNTPFNLQEERFKWQTSAQTREIINYENYHLGIKASPEKNEKTYTIIPNRIPEFKPLAHIKCNNNNINRKKSTSSIVDLKAKLLEEPPKYKPSKQYKQRYEDKSPPRISSLIKKTPINVFPNFGKKRVSVKWYYEECFKPSLKQISFEKCFKGSLIGAAALSNKNGQDVDSAVSKKDFSKMKTDKSNKLILKNKSVNFNIDKVKGFNRNRNDRVDNTEKKSFFKSNYSQNFNNANNGDYDHSYDEASNKKLIKENNKVGNSTSIANDKKLETKIIKEKIIPIDNEYESNKVKKFSKKLSASVIDFRFKSNFKII